MSPIRSFRRQHRLLWLWLWWSAAPQIITIISPFLNQTTNYQYQKETSNIGTNILTFTCFCTTDMFINQILMIPALLKSENDPLSFPKARNALKPNYLTKKCKILFQISKIQKSKKKRTPYVKNHQESNALLRIEIVSDRCTSIPRSF